MFDVFASLAIVNRWRRDLRNLLSHLITPCLLMLSLLYIPVNLLMIMSLGCDVCNVPIQQVSLTSLHLCVQVNYCHHEESTLVVMQRWVG